MTRLLQQRFPKLGHGGRVLLNPVPSAVDGGTRREAPAESSVLLQKTLPLSRNLISFALPIAFLCGFLVLLVSPYGPRLSPDSGGYILMASEAYRNGPLGITIDQWPPGLPWLLWLVMLVIGPDALFAGLIVNSLSIGACCFVLSYGILEVLQSQRTFASEYNSVLSVLLCTFLSLVLVSATVHSTIASHVWSEAPFLACVSLGLWFLTQPGKKGWALLFCALSCSIRFVGVFTFPVVLYHLLSRAILNKRKMKEILSYAPASFGAALLILSTVFFFIQSSLWQQRGNPRLRKSLMQCVADYAETFLGLLSPSGIELSLRAFVVTSIISLVLIGVGTWMMLKGQTFEHKANVFPWENEAVWLLWIVVYSLGVSHLMAKNGIGETHRFVTPILTAFLWLGVRWILWLPSPRFRNGLLLSLVLLLSLNMKSAIAASVQSFQQENRARVLISGPHVRATDEFKATKRIASQAQSIYFVGVQEGSRRWAQILAGFFNCRRMYFSTVGNVPQRFDFHEPTLVVSDTKEVPFIDYLREQNALLFEGEKLQFALWLVKPTATQANLLVEPFSEGCE